MRPDPERFAELLAGYCLDVQPGQQVLVRSTTHAAPLLLALQRAIVEREAWRAMRVLLADQTEGYWAAARDVHLDGLAPAELADTEGSDCLLRILAPENTSELAGVDPARLARAARSRQPLSELAMRRRWCGTVWPTPAGGPPGGVAAGGLAPAGGRGAVPDRGRPVRPGGGRARSPG